MTVDNIECELGVWAWLEGVAFPLPEYSCRHGFPQMAGPNLQKMLRYIFHMKPKDIPKTVGLKLEKAFDLVTPNATDEERK
jgi:hypothetical protein